jgi:hypothetical protein
MATHLVRCRVCGSLIRLPRGDLLLPPHPHQDPPDVPCSGAGTVGVPAPEPPGAISC